MENLPDGYDGSLRRIIGYAEQEAQRFKHNYVGTEHLLLGLLRGESTLATRVLSTLGVEINKVRSAVEFIIGRGDRVVLDAVGLTRGSKRVLELAEDEAKRLKSETVGPEHLLLGLVREGEGIAAGVLESLGVNLSRVRAETTRVLGANHPQGAPAPSPVEPSIVELLQRARNVLSRGQEALTATGKAELAAAVADISATLGTIMEAEVERNTPERLREPMRRLESLRREKDSAIAAQQYEYAAELRERELKLQEQIEEMEAALTSGGEASAAAGVKKDDLNIHLNASRAMAETAKRFLTPEREATFGPELDEIIARLQGPIDQLNAEGSGGAETQENG